MKWCVTFPEEDILIKRPCLKKACGGNKAAATFLSYLLYQVSISREYKKTAENINKRKVDNGERPDQITTGSVFRTQLEIIEELDNELSDRTLRDTAIPWLVALEYIEVDTSHPVNVYIVHLEQVQKAINHPPNDKELKQAQERFQHLTGKISEANAIGETSVSNGRTSSAIGRTSVSNGETSVSNGRTSSTQNRPRRASQASSSGIFRQPKKKKKSNYDSNKRVEEESDYSENHQPGSPATAPSEIDLQKNEGVGELTEEEIALIVAYRHKQVEPIEQATSTEIAFGEILPVVTEGEESERAEIVTQGNAEQKEALPQRSVPDMQLVVAGGQLTKEEPLQRPGSDEQLTEEVVLELWESKRCERYEGKGERAAQLRAAKTLLETQLPLSVDVLEQIYDECCDDWWKEHYGDLHVTHLVEKEKSGQRRIVRLLKRVQNRGRTAAANRHMGALVEHRTETEKPERLVEWNGRLVPEEQAYQEGYYGGFERFKKSDYPDDDLEATLKRLQAEGKLPLLEEVING